MPPRVLLFINTSWNLWNFRLRLIEHLKARGYEVVLTAPPDDYSARLAKIARFVPFPMDRKGRNPLSEFATFLRAVKLLHTVRPDAVLTWTPKPNIYSALAGQILRIPVMPNVAGLGYAFIGGGWLARVAGALYGLAFRRCRVVFFQNAHDRDQFVASGWLQKGATRLVPGSGVDLARFQAKAPRQGPDFVFLYAGRLLSDKGVRELVEATRLLKSAGSPVRLRLLGFADPGNPTSVSETELGQWQQDGLAEYLGRSDRVEEFMADADCVVLPSYREGMPRTLLEAAACARPVVATDAPGCRDAVVDGVTGFLCKPRDAASLAEAMRRMMALSPAEREAMGRAGRERVEREFSDEIVIAAYEAALAEVLGAGAKARYAERSAPG